MSRSKKLLLGIVAMGLVVLGVRVLLPMVLLKFSNDRLAQLPGYSGHIDDLDLHVLRGAYEIKGINIRSKEGEASARPHSPLSSLRIPRIDVALSWEHLMERALVGELIIDQAQVELIPPPGSEEVAAEKAKEGAQSWQDALTGFMPIKIERLQIKDASLTFHHPAAKLDAKAINLAFYNLTNSLEVANTYMSRLHGSAIVLGDGKLELDLKFNPLSKQPYFDLTTKLAGLKLVSLNPLLRAMYNIDFERGTLSAASELACNKGQLKGYVKPVFKDIDIFSWREDVVKKKKGTLTLVKEALAGATSGTFKNHPHDQLATKIPLEGQLAENVHTDPWSVVSSVLQNAFVRPLSARIEDSISFNDVKS